jgi:hypothetical protein
MAETLPSPSTPALSGESKAASISSATVIDGALPGLAQQIRAYSRRSRDSNCRCRHRRRGLGDVNARTPTGYTLTPVRLTGR